MSDKTYEGTPCKRGKHTVRYSSNGSCVKCIKKRQSTKKYRLANTEAVKAHFKSNPIRNVYNTACSRINTAMKGSSLKFKAKELLGCTPKELYDYFCKINKTDQPINTLHQDHIIPIFKFNLELESELRSALHFSNIQLLTKKDHMDKTKAEIKERLSRRGKKL